MTLKWENSTRSTAIRAMSQWHDEGSAMYHEILTVKQGGFILTGDVVGVATRYETLEEAKAAAEMAEPEEAKP